MNKGGFMSLNGNYLSDFSGPPTKSDKTWSAGKKFIAIIAISCAAYFAAKFIFKASPEVCLIAAFCCICFGGAYLLDRN